jgi:hypothetical protein
VIEDEETNFDFNSKAQNRRKLKELGFFTDVPDLTNNNKIGKERRTKLDDIYIDSKDLPDKPEGIPWSDDPATMQMLLQRKANREQYEREHKKYLKEQEEYQRGQEESAKRRKQEQEARQEASRRWKDPQVQIQRFLSGQNYNFEVVEPLLFNLCRQLGKDKVMSLIKKQ